MEDMLVSDLRESELRDNPAEDVLLSMHLKLVLSAHSVSISLAETLLLNLNALGATTRLCDTKSSSSNRILRHGSNAYAFSRFIVVDSGRESLAH